MKKYFFYDTHLQAIRSGKWKLILERPAQPQWLSDLGLKKHHRGRDVEEIKTPQLYNLDEDIGESLNLANTNPEIVKRLLKIANTARYDLGDYNQIGKGVRFYDNGIKRPD